MSPQLRIACPTIALALASVWLADPGSAVAHTPAEGEAPIAVYTVRHDHAVGSGPGELRILPGGIEFRGEGDEASDSRAWRDEDIKRIEIRKEKFKVFIYEAARIPVLPPHVPFVHRSKAVRHGSEREYEFRLMEGEVAPEDVRALLGRFKRPVATTVIPTTTEESGEFLFEIPVFHRHVSGGESGALRVYDGHIVFDAETADHSRHWRYSDIRDVARLGRYGFEISTYEDKRWTDGKSYVFDLKRPMLDGEFEALWSRLYGQRLGE